MKIRGFNWTVRLESVKPVKLKSTGQFGTISSSLIKKENIVIPRSWLILQNKFQKVLFISRSQMLIIHEFQLWIYLSYIINLILPNKNFKKFKNQKDQLPKATSITAQNGLNLLRCLLHLLPCRRTLYHWASREATC